MKTGIFASCVGRRHAGPEVYERNLIGHIAKIDRENEYHVFCLGQSAVDAVKIQQENFHFHAVTPSSRWLGLLFGLPAALRRQSISLYHATLVPAPMSRSGFVFTQHDVSPFLHPEFYPRPLGLRLRAMIKFALRRASRIICISQHAKDTTVEMLGVGEDRVSVVHHGVHPRFRPLDRVAAQEVVKSKFGIEPPFVLYMGKLEQRKNTGRLIEAFGALARTRDEEWKLVLAGKRFWGMDGIDAALLSHGLRDKVVEIGYVADEDQPSLYCAAEMFVFPTLWEGFGLPILEAMACGTPTITSNVSCLPEIAGSAAVLVNPYRVEEIAAAMSSLADDRDARAQLSARGPERAKLFTWEATARKTIDVYREAHDG